MTFINLIFTLSAEWKDLKSIVKWRVTLFLFSTSASPESHWSLTPNLESESGHRRVPWPTSSFQSGAHIVVKVPSSRVPIKRRSPVRSPAWKLQWGNGHTIIYRIWLAAQVWVSLEDLSSPQNMMSESRELNVCVLLILRVSKLQVMNQLWLIKTLRV